MGHASAAAGGSSSGAKTAGNTGRGAPNKFSIGLSFQILREVGKS